MDFRIDPEFEAHIPPLSESEAADLEASIREHGCLSPLVVWDGFLIDGHHRFRICQRHQVSFDTVAVDLPNRDAALDWIDRNQLGRRNLTPDQVTLLMGRVYNRQKKPSGGRTGREFSGDQNEPPKRTAEKVAADFGVSPATIKRAGKVVEELTNEEQQAVLKKERALTQIKRDKKEEAREQRRAENAEKVAAAPEPTKSGARYATIMIDPPWDWGDEGDQDQLGRARPTYQTIPYKKLLQLPVPELADEDCHLYLWTTNRSLPKCFAMMERWGFRYITALTWPKPSFGMGNYFRGQTEHLLFGVKGSQPLKRKDASTLLPQWKRGSNGHSSKPEELYAFIETCSPGPYLELFARKRHEGWVAWGAEV